MHLERHVKQIQAAALTPFGLVPLPPFDVELLVLVRDDGSKSPLMPAPPQCHCPRHRPCPN
jgi:hypothetical protein